MIYDNEMKDRVEQIKAERDHYKAALEYIATDKRSRYKSQLQQYARSILALPQR